MPKCEHDWRSVLVWSVIVFVVADSPLHCLVLITGVDDSEHQMERMIRDLNIGSMVCVCVCVCVCPNVALVNEMSYVAMR